VRRFVIIGRNASAADDFTIDDVPGTGGRLDIGLRCIRAGLLVSHGVRRDAVVYLVLGGGPRAPRVLRIAGAEARFLRPDERSLAVLVKKALATRADEDSDRFVDVRHGIAIARGGLDRAIADLGASSPYMMERTATDRSATDIRDVEGLGDADCSFFLGDHLGFDDAARASLAVIRARAIGVGPACLHTEDVIAIVSNEIDRRLSRVDRGGPG
jgi:tRNA (pseudouridine54-N1)-methyltransferase